MEYIRGYKVFNPNWTCRNKQYTCPGVFEEDVIPAVCNRGMHFCRKATDCFNYYDFDPKNHVAEVIALAEYTVEDGDKCATNHLEIVREVQWTELLEIVNMGKGCIGLGNSGDWNSGDYNSGDWNKTNFSNGCFNTVEPKIYLFNKPSAWTYWDWLNSDARLLLNLIPGDVFEYVWYKDMTDEEKAAHPEAETTGRYLKKVRMTAEIRQAWWDDLSTYAKKIILSLPNFDTAIFKEITGIDVKKEKI